MPVEKNNDQPEQTDTGGGAYIEGDADVGGNLIGRDQVTIGQVVVVMGGIQQKLAVKTELGEGEPPYRGLEVYNVADAAFFFGRERLTAALVDYLRQHDFLAVIGASGSGKSSLVRAGLIPALQSGAVLADGRPPPLGSARWPVHLVLPSADPLLPLAASLTWDEAMADQLRLTDSMQEDDRSLNAMVHRILSRPEAEGETLLLVVDQFEELFTRCRDKAKRQAFVDNLLTAAAGGVTKVVITLRADFYHHCAEFDNLRQAVQDRQIYIGAMSQEELRRTIEKPAELGGWEFEEGLVDQLLRDVAGEPGALPLLSHALLETWKRREGRTLTFAGYQVPAIRHQAGCRAPSPTPQRPRSRH